MGIPTDQTSTPQGLGREATPRLGVLIWGWGRNNPWVVTLAQLVRTQKSPAPSEPEQMGRLVS